MNLEKKQLRTGKVGECGYVLSLMKPSTEKRTISSFVYPILGAIVPSCDDALRLVELGQQRPLHLHERFILFYNSPLCLHCNCKRVEFDKQRVKLREIEASR